MRKNMGTIDRIARVVIAAVIAILYFTSVITGTLGIMLLVLAGVFVLTSLIGFLSALRPIWTKHMPD